MTKPLRKNDIKVYDNDIDYVLKRPGIYVGSTKEETRQVYLFENSKIIQKEITFVPAILKLFDEVVSNSLDEAIRTNFEYATKIKVDYDEVTGRITVRDNGRGLPIEWDENYKKWTPEIIFTQLKAGSNFDDDSKGEVIGTNGVGISLCNIFSRCFEVETANGAKYYSQSYENNLHKINPCKVRDDKRNFTEVSFIPNYDYFSTISDFIETKKILNCLFYKRIRDLAFAYPEITWIFNKEKLIGSNLKQYLSQIHDIFEFNEVDKGRIGIFYSDTDFQHMSFVNGANTYRAGTHVDYCVTQIVDHIREFLRKKHKLEVKPADIRSKLFLVLSMRMNSPEFDGQTKEALISTNGFKNLIDDLLTEKFLKSITKNDEIILPIVEAYKLKLQVKENIELKKLSKTVKKVRIDKYYPAIQEKKYCIFAEGDSAQNSVMSILGRSVYSYFALKGKPLNVLTAKMDKIKENEEIKNIVQITNLRLDKDEQSGFNYKNILIASDQDFDGHHIKGLILTLFYKFGLSLLKQNRIKFLRTPIIVGFNKKGEIIEHYFTLDEYKKNQTLGTVYTYYKGLGTWEQKDLEFLINKYGIEYFIQDFEWNDKSEQRILSWLGGKDNEFKKEKLRGKIFDLNAV